MTVPRRAITQWCELDPDRAVVAEVLQAAEFQIDYIHDGRDDRAWGLLLKLPVELAEVIGTQREVLLWGSMHAEAQARDLERALEFLNRNSVRCAQDVVIMLTKDPQGRDVIEEAAQGSSVAVLTLSLSQLRKFRPYGSDRLSDEVRARLFARDLYDLRSPVTRNADFFGRSALLSQLERSLVQSRSHVAIFGLRKIGKTSFILRLREALRNRQAGVIAQADLQRANAINPTAEYLLWHLGESLWDGNRRVRGVGDLRLFGRHTTYADVPDKGSIFELFDHDIRAIHQRIGSPVIVMLDEIERMFPFDANSRWLQDFIRFWQLLRGLDQEQPDHLRFIISGTNPQCVERHALFGEDNPIYSYFSNTYLGPLSKDEAAQLLRTYGERMGLLWTDSVIARAYDDTGGHPALLRTYASMVHRKSHPRARAATPRVEDARDVASRFLIEQGPLLAQVVAILEDQYADEFEILRTLALGKVHEFREMARAFPEDTAHLIGYGLCAQPTEATRLSSQLLQTYIQRRETAGAHGAWANAATDLVGAQVDGRYRIDSLISSKGGYADVYRATQIGAVDSAEGTGSVAVKVLRHGQLSVLEREVEVLQRFSHRNIVKFIDSGRLDNGHVYLAMEYLEGDTLRAYCEAATRPSEQRLMAWTLSLLDALVHMHPKEAQLRQLRAESRSDDELQSLLEARYGYVHRDIKPENVIITPRGPVLVDFNISIRVSEPVQTISATPGYLPPELLGPSWSPRVDLYQLGVTLLQVAAGETLMADNRDDLVMIMRSAVSPKTAHLIERLMDTSTSGYQTAYTARRDAQRIVDQLGG